MYGIVLSKTVRIIEGNGLFDNSFLNLVPNSLLDTDIADDNQHQLGIEIDKYRLQKEGEFAALLGLSNNWSRIKKERNFLKSAINDKKSFPGYIENIRRHILFLNALAQVVIHQ